MCILQMFFPGCGLSSDSLDTVFCRAEVCNFIEVQLISYSFHGFFLRYFVLKRHHRTRGRLKFLPWFNSGSLLGLHFALRPCRHTLPRACLLLPRPLPGLSASALHLPCVSSFNQFHHLSAVDPLRAVEVGNQGNKD